MSRLALPLQGILWMILTGFLCVCIYGMALHLSRAFGFHAFQIIFFYNFAGLLFYLPSLLRRRLSLKTQQFPLFATRGVLEFCAFSLSITGLTMLPLPVHTALSFTSPLFGSLAAVLLLREPNSLHRWISLLIGFIGVLIVSRPGLTSFEIPALYVLAGAVCFAFCGITIKRLTATEPSTRIAFYMMLLTAIISLPFAVWKWHPLTLAVLPYLLALGAMVAAVQFTVSLAYSKADVTVILPFNFLNIVWSSAIAYIVFRQLVDGWTVLGALVIVGAAAYGIRYAGRGTMASAARASAGSS
ncbi:MAG: DMT family transporter [Rickettsiales bacterium]|nr:DMT family transporter [Rickettsiales bacterium]